ncbi:MAG: helix-turn-helix domain-containing protein [Phycisphaerales bacterium]
MTPAGCLQLPASDTPTPMRNLGQTIHERRKALRLTLQAVADRAGCTKGYLSSLENDSRDTVPSEAMLRRLEKALEFAEGTLVLAGVWKATPSPVREHVRSLEDQSRAGRRLAELLQREGVDDVFKRGELERLVNSLCATASGEGGAAGGAGGGSGGNLAMMGSLPMQVPVVNRVAAGYPREFTDLGYPARVADEYVSVPDVYDADAFAARVVGDSMEPVYREGDIVVFSPSAPTVEGSDCFVRFERNEETTFKRVYFEGVAEDRDERGGSDPGGVPGVSGDGAGGVGGASGAGAEIIRLQPLNPAYAPRSVLREEVAGLYAAVYVVRAVKRG